MVKVKVSLKEWLKMADAKLSEAVSVADLYKKTLGTKKVYDKTIARDLAKFGVPHRSMQVGGKLVFFVETEEAVEQIKACLKTKNTKHETNPQRASIDTAGLLEKVLARLEQLEAQLKETTDRLEKVEKGMEAYRAEFSRRKSPVRRKAR